MDQVDQPELFYHLPFFLCQHLDAFDLLGCRHQRMEAAGKTPSPAGNFYRSKVEHAKRSHALVFRNITTPSPLALTLRACSWCPSFCFELGIRRCSCRGRRLRAFEKPGFYLSDL